MALVDILKVSMEDYLGPIVFVCVLLFLVWNNDRQTWLAFDNFTSVVFGIIFCFSNFYVNMQIKGELDEPAHLLNKVFGLALIGTTLFWMLTRETLDGTVPITLMTARVFSSAVILMCQFYTHFGTTKGKKNIDFTDKHIYYGMSVVVVMLLGHLYFLLRSHDFSSYPQHHIKINEFLRVDALLSLLMSILFLAFPDMVLKHFFPDMKSPNCVHLQAVRCTGAVFLNFAIVSLQAPGFLHERDKRSHFSGRLVAHMLLFVPFIWGAVTTSQFTLRQIEWALLISLPIVVNGVMGYLAGGTILYRFTSSSSSSSAANTTKTTFVTSRSTLLSSRTKLD